MTGIDVALTWIAFSAVSAKGLSAFARAAATRGAEADLALLDEDTAWEHDCEDLLDTPFCLARRRS
jgi:hypothetical protein